MALRLLIGRSVETDAGSLGATCASGWTSGSRVTYACVSA